MTQFFQYLLKGIYMVLSDTCSDISWQLASDIVHTLDWGYDLDDISRLVDVLFSIASFQAKQDVPFFSEFEQANAKNRIVIGMFKSLLEKADDDSRIKFSEVIKLNRNLSAALNPTSAEPSIIFI